MAGFFFKEGIMVSRILNRSAACFLFISFICSCASAPPSKKEVISPDLQIKEGESSKQVKAMNDMILISSLSPKGDPHRDYKIGPEDLLEMSVFDVEKLNKTVRVSSQGNINLPLIGTLRVKGLTAGELEKEIRELLSEKYLQDPQVSVFIKEYRSQRISVIGAVGKPGIFEVSGQKTILDLLAMAGGFSEDAGQLLFLIRPDSNSSSPPLEETPRRAEREEPAISKPQTFVIDLEDLLVKGDLTLNVPLLHGDLLNIPLSGKVYVAGEVKAPGGFPIKGKRITVGQAITMAGGPTPKADGPETKIFRYAGKERKKEILSVNLDAIAKGNEEDFILKENDIVMVPKSGRKAFFTEFWEFIKGRVGSVALGTL